MKLLHTSDWHLGRTLYSKKDRQEEQISFLNYLLGAIKENSIDLLIVAGDIFDSTSPSNSTQKIYYDFLLNVRNTGCKNVVIIGGNHDSPSFLNAPKEILAVINVFVVGNASENIEDEIIVVKDIQENPIAIVCAVPFLRERDISRFTEGETYGDRSKRIAENIKKHYQNIAEIAENKRININRKIPIIATGHLSVAGGKTIEDDGVKETYFGGIECVSSEIFPSVFNYVALGHYHICSKIENNVRYCGSPIPMGFGEADQRKSVYIVDFKENIPEISKLEIPTFQKLESIKGDKLFIYNRLNELKKLNSSVWVEIIYDGTDPFPNFTAWANDNTRYSKIEIIKLQNKKYLNEVLYIDEKVQSLDDLDEYEVFNKLLEKRIFSDKQKTELKNMYSEIINEVNEKIRK